MVATNILTGRGYYKPFNYPKLFELFTSHEKKHWIAEELKLDDDIRHWNDRLSEPERRLATELFRFFVQADSDVLDGYGHLIKHFQGTPEAAMVLSSIAAREATHLSAYSLLIDTLNMPENIYKDFLEYEVMSEKHDYVQKAFDDLNTLHLAHLQNPDSSSHSLYLEALAKVVCITGCFVEGFQLFSSFVVLKNFEHTYKAMPGMNDVVDWSIKDESDHVETCETLYKIMKQEFFDEVDFKGLEAEIQSICGHMVEMEQKFVDLMFDAAEDQIKGLTRDEVKQFVIAMANGRLKQFGIEPCFPETPNPLTWFDFLVYGKGHTNFFERRATEYAKGTITGSLGEESFDF